MSDITESETKTQKPRGSLESSIYAAKVRLLYKETLPSLIGNLGVAAVIAILFNGFYPGGALIAWFIGIAAVSGGRYWLMLRFKETKPAESEMSGWARAFVAILTRLADLLIDRSLATNQAASTGRSRVTSQSATQSVGTSQTVTTQPDSSVPVADQF